MRIRVTVEADEDGVLAGPPIEMSPTTRSHGLTVKVPLNDAGAETAVTSDAPKKRVPRKRTSHTDGDIATDTTPKAKKTPAKRTPTRRQSGIIEDILDAAGDVEAQGQSGAEGPRQDEEPVKRRRGRPRKSDTGATPAPSTKKAVSKSTRVSVTKTAPTKDKPMAESQAQTTAAETGPAQRPGRKRMDFSAMTPLHMKNKDPTIPTAQAQLVQTPPIGKSVQGRVPTPRKPSGWADKDDEDEEDGRDVGIEDVAEIVTEPANSSEDDQGDAESHHEDVHDDAEIYDDEEEDQETPTDVAEDSTMALDKSLAESEGFTMVSIEALKTQQKQLQEQPSLNEHDSRHEDSTPSLSSGSRLPAQSRSPHNQTDHPSQAPRPSRSKTTTPRLSKSPSAPPAVRSSPFRRSPSRESESAVKAGVALQHAVQVNRTEEIPAGSRPFEAYGTGTRRELRKGFSIGEVLARGGKAQASKSGDRAAADLQSGPLSKGAQTSEARLPTPADSVRDESSSSVRSYDDMSWRPTTLPRNHAPNDATYDEMSWRPTAPTALREAENADEQPHKPDGTGRDHAREELEAEHEDAEYDVEQSIELGSSPPIRRQDTQQSWAQDGDAVNASAEHILNGSDIWYEEADRSLEDSFLPQRERQRPARQVADHQSIEPLKQSAPYGCPKDSPGASRAITPQKRAIVPFNKAAPSPVPSLSDLLPTENRPTRAKLPRTWRRASGSDFLYSDETESPRQALPSSQKPSKSPGAIIGSLVPSVFTRWAGAASKEPGTDSQMKPNEATSSRGRETTPSTAHQPLRGILSSPAHRASSPAKEVHWRADGDLEDVSRAQGADAQYFSSGSESPSSELGPDDDSSPIGVEDHSMHGEEAVEDHGGDVDEDVQEDEQAQEEVDYSFASQESREQQGSSFVSQSDTTRQSNSEMDTSDVRQLRRELQEMPTLQSNSRKRPLSPLRDVQHDAAGNSSLLQPQKKHRRLFAEDSLQSTKRSVRTVKTTEKGRPRLRQVAPAREQATTSFLARLSSWIFAPAITTPIPRTSVPAPGQLQSPKDVPKATPEQAQPPKQTRPNPPPYVWTNNHTILLSHYATHASLLALPPPRPQPPPGPPLNRHYHDTFLVIPKSFTTYLDRTLTASAYCTSHSSPKPTTTSWLSYIGLAPTSAPPRNIYAVTTTSGCTPSTCLGVPPSVRAKIYSHTMTESDVRVAWAFVREVYDRGVPLVKGVGGNGEMERDEEGRVVRVREDWGNGAMEAEWVVRRVLAVRVAPAVEADVVAVRGRGW